MPDYYDSSSDGMDDSAKPSQAESDESTKPKDEKDDEATALLPKSILGGKKFKVGEEVVLKIVHEYEDEVEVSYAKEHKDEEGMEESDRGDEMSNSMKSLEESMS